MKPFTVIVRGYKGGKLLWERRSVFVDADIERIIPTLAEEHAAEMAAGKLGMIEMEFVDEHDPLQRFFRIGVEKEGMVLPVKIDLKGDD